MIKDGIYNNISITTYHKDKDSFSSSSLKLAKKSLRLFQMWKDGIVDTQGKEIRTENSHFDFGNAFELALLDRESFNKDVFVYDTEDRPEKDKTMGSKLNREWSTFVKNTDKYVINQTGRESFDIILKMLESCYQDAVIQKLIQNIDYQSSIFWTDKETGLKLKTRPDICNINKNVIVDVKTTADGSPEKFKRDLVNFDYPFQAVMQIDGVLKSGYMERVDAYYWLVVEKEPPYSATIYEFDQEDINWVADEYQYVIHSVAKAMMQDKYPSYSYRADNKYGILRADIPMYYKNFGL